MDEVLVYVIVAAVGVIAIAIGALFALDYWRKRRGIEPPPVNVRCEHETGLRKFFRWVSRLFVLAMWVVFGIYSVVDAFLLILVGGAALTYWRIRRYARAGVLVRRDAELAVARQLSTMSFVLLFLGLCMCRGEEVVGLGWAMASLVVASLFYMLKSKRGLQRPYFGLLVPAACMVPILLLSGPSSPLASPLDRSTALEFVENEDLLTEMGLMTSRRWASVIRELAGDGGVTPDISRVLVASLEPEYRHALPEVRDAVCVEELAEHSYLQGRDYDEIGALQFAWMLEGTRGWRKDTVLRKTVVRLRERDLSAEYRLGLAIRLGSQPLRTSRKGHLHDLVVRLRVMEQLGHPEQGESYAQVTRELLGQEKFRYGTDTYDAVLLMERFGVPDELDLKDLHMRLSQEARESWVVSLKIGSVLAYMTLAALERLPEWQPIAESRSGWAYRFWRQRLAWSALFVAIACIVITAGVSKGAGSTAEA